MIYDSVSSSAPGASEQPMPGAASSKFSDLTASLWVRLSAAAEMQNIPVAAASIARDRVVSGLSAVYSYLPRKFSFGAAQASSPPSEEDRKQERDSKDALSLAPPAESPLLSPAEERMVPDERVLKPSSFLQEITPLAKEVQKMVASAAPVASQQKKREELAQRIQDKLNQLHSLIESIEKEETPASQKLLQEYQTTCGQLKQLQLRTKPFSESVYSLLYRLEGLNRSLATHSLRETISKEEQNVFFQMTSKEFESLQKLFTTVPLGYGDAVAAMFFQTHTHLKSICVDKELQASWIKTLWHTLNSNSSFSREFYGIAMERCERLLPGKLQLSFSSQESLAFLNPLLGDSCQDHQYEVDKSRMTWDISGESLPRLADPTAKLGTLGLRPTGLTRLCRLINQSALAASLEMMLLGFPAPTIAAYGNNLRATVHQKDGQILVSIQHQQRLDYTGATSDRGIATITQSFCLPKGWLDSPEDPTSEAVSMNWQISVTPFTQSWFERGVAFWSSSAS